MLPGTQSVLCVTGTVLLCYCTSLYSLLYILVLLCTWYRVPRIYENVDVRVARAFCMLLTLVGGKGWGASHVGFSYGMPQRGALLHTTT